MKTNKTEDKIVIEKAPKQWARSIFSGAELGDKRRTERLTEVASAMMEAPDTSFLASCRGDKAKIEGTYRWLENDKIDFADVLEAGCQSTRQWCDDKIEGDILALSDTSTVGYEHSVRDELGDLGGSKIDRRRGLFVHSVLMVAATTAEYVGLGDQIFWQRSDAQRGKKHQRKQRDYQEKESFKWEYAIERVAERFVDYLHRLIFVSDRESDIYELLMYLHGHDLRHVVRASWNRKLDREEEKLFEQVGSVPDMCEVMVHIPQRGGRSPRWARVRVRACTVTLSAPVRDNALPPLTVNVVQAEEQVGDSPMVWTLLTSEAIETVDQLLYVLRCYGLRWKIEDFFRCWKTGGTNVEGLKLQSLNVLLRGAVVLAFVAMRLAQLRDSVDPQVASSLSRMYVSRDFTPTAGHPSNSSADADTSSEFFSIPELPCEDVFSRLEWQVLWLAIEEGRRLPEDVPNRLWAYHAMGRLGGWGDTKRTGRVGLKALWLG